MVFPVILNAGVMFTEFPPVILKLPGATIDNDCEANPGNEIVFEAGPTVSVLPLSAKLGAIVTVLPLEILKLFVV